MAEAAVAGRPSPMQRLAARLAALGGWRRLAVAATLGAVSVAALPPLHIVPALIPAFTGLLWQLDGVRSRAGAFALGWAFGLGHFAAGLYWVGIAFFVDAPTYGWMMPFAVGGLAAGLAAFTGLASLATWMVPWTGMARILVLPVAWTAAAWLRGHVLTGFPWNVIATAWGFSDAAVQPVALFGAWGLSLVTVFAAASPASLAGGGTALRRWAPVAAAAVLMAALAGGGAVRIHLAPAPGTRDVPDVRLRLVQANVPQHLKWRDDLRIEHLKRHLRMSRKPGEGVTHVIWPETAVPYFLSNQPDLTRALATAAPAGGALLTGVPRVETTADRRALYNAFVAVDETARTVAVYDKFHLVPFGEYVPLSAWLPVDKLAAGRSDFAAGPGPRTIRVPGLPPFSPLICYEAIFPGRVLDPRDRPAWLLNVTNDAWFGQSSGPYQHLAAARLRAVEEGLPLVRVANTGISVVVDAYGRTRARLGLNRRGTIETPLPRGLGRLTPYARWGDATFGGVLVLAIMAAAATRRC